MTFECFTILFVSLPTLTVKCSPLIIIRTRVDNINYDPDLVSQFGWLAQASFIVLYFGARMYSVAPSIA